MSKKWQPTINQERFVEALLEGKNVKESAEQAKVTRQSYYDWRKNPDFMAYLEQRRREVASARTPRVDNELFKKIEEGDVPAMRLFYEVFGNLRTGQVVINNKREENQEPEAGKKVLSMLDELEAKRKVKLNAVKKS